MHQREIVVAAIELGVPLQRAELLGEGHLLRLGQLLVAEDEKLVGQEGLVHRLLRRLVEFGSGFKPLGSPNDEDLERLRSAMVAAGREMGELEMVGGTRGRFVGPEGVAHLGQALASIPAQLERGFTTICIKPSQFIDDPDEIGAFCGDVVERVDALVG